MFRKAVTDCDGKQVIFDTSLSFGEDEVWLVRVLRQCKGIAFVPEPLYHWRPRQGSVTRFNSITEKQLSLLRAKKIALELLPHREDVIKLAKCRTFNDCYLMKVQAYCSNDSDNYKLIDDELKPMRKSWIMSNDPPRLRKIKVIILDTLMRCHCSDKLVGLLSSFNRYTISR